MKYNSVEKYQQKFVKILPIIKMFEEFMELFEFLLLQRNVI